MKAIVLIFKHATFLRLLMSPGPTLIQADLDYQEVDVDQKIRQHVAASQGHSVELDRAFIMSIEMVRQLSLSVQIKQTFYFYFRCDKCVCKRWIVGWNGFWNWHFHTCCCVTADLKVV